MLKSKKDIVVTNDFTIRVNRKLHVMPEARLLPEEEEMLREIVDSEVWDVKTLEQIRNKNRKLFLRIFNVGVGMLSGDDRDVFIERIYNLRGEDAKNTLWQHNHVSILSAISNLTVKCGRFPSRSEIQKETGISKQTINKHLKEYFGSEEYNCKKEEYLIMRERVLAAVFHEALSGNTKAARVFLEATDQFTDGPKIKNQQNNYIQINGAIITQDQIKELPLGKLNQLQKILAAVHKQIPNKQTEKNESSNTAGI